MDKSIEPLFNDEYTGEPPTKRLLAFIQGEREKGKNVVGMYCSYAPSEIIHAFGMVPAVLCAFSNGTIKIAEETLPANLCPLIKSSYGFIVSDTCPFFSLSDIIIGETTCDGKKKMFELISEKKPLHVMDLPQLPDEKEAVLNWALMIRKMKNYFQDMLKKEISDEEIEKAIKDTNRKNTLMGKIFDYAAMSPPVISWAEQYDIIALAQSAAGEDIYPKLEDIIAKLENRVESGYCYGREGAPRVLVTGCPIGGDAAKIYKIIEDAGGVVVALDSCMGMKMFRNNAEEESDDPIVSISKKYLKIPCSCMTPNKRRIEELDNFIEKFKPDMIVDFVLQACHSYNIESHKIGRHVRDKYDIQFLKIVSDYSESDIEQIRTRVEATMEKINA